MSERKGVAATTSSDALGTQPTASYQVSQFTKARNLGYVPAAPVVKTGAAATPEAVVPTGAGATLSKLLPKKAADTPLTFEQTGVKPLNEQLPPVDFRKSANVRHLNITSTPISLIDLHKQEFKRMEIVLGPKQTASHFRDPVMFGITGAPAKAGAPGGNLKQMLVLEKAVRKTADNFPFPVGVRLKCGPSADKTDFMFPHRTSHNLAGGDHHTVEGKDKKPMQFAFVINPGEQMTATGNPTRLYQNTDVDDPELANARRWWGASHEMLMKGINFVGENNETFLLPRGGLAASVAMANPEFMDLGRIMTPQLDRTKISKEHNPSAWENLQLPGDKCVALFDPVMQAISQPRLTDFSYIVAEFHPLINNSVDTPASYYPHLRGEALERALNKKRYINFELESHTCFV